MLELVAAYVLIGAGAASARLPERLATVAATTRNRWHLLTVVAVEWLLALVVLSVAWPVIAVCVYAVAVARNRALAQDILSALKELQERENQPFKRHQPRRN